GLVGGSATAQDGGPWTPSLCFLCLLLPPAHCRSNRSCAGSLATTRRPLVEASHTLCLGVHFTRSGLGKKNLDRRHPGARCGRVIPRHRCHGLLPRAGGVGRSGLWRPALLRAFGLCGHGHWSCTVVWHTHAAQCSFALQGGLRHRLLAALARHIVSIPAGLPLHTPGWISQRPLQTLRESYGYHDSWWLMAWRGLAISCVGRRSWGNADHQPSVAGYHAMAHTIVAWRCANVA